MNSATLNSVGLVLDIIGVILLFLYGLQSDAERPHADGHGMILWPGVVPASESRKLDRRWRRHLRLSQLGLALLVLGFVLQIVSNHAPLSLPPAQPLWIFGSAVVGGIWLWMAWLAARGR